MSPKADKEDRLREIIEEIHRATVPPLDTFAHGHTLLAQLYAIRDRLDELEIRVAVLQAAFQSQRAGRSASPDDSAWRTIP